MKLLAACALVSLAYAGGVAWRLAAAGPGQRLKLSPPAPVAVADAWAHNLRVLELHCGRTTEAWDRIASGPFRQTVQYDDVEAHKACQHARGLGCVHGPCVHPVLWRGCLNSRRDMCCDRRHKRCHKIM